MPTYEEQVAIQAIVADRNIPYLVHFTRVENLPSILRNGLCPRGLLNGLNNEVTLINDTVRADGKTGYNCLSISFPNCSMFWRCRIDENGERDNTDWAVLLISKRILSEKNCLFYPINAATNTVSGLPIHNFNNANALEAMFAYDRDHWLENHDPTDVQAEVLVEGIIEPEYFGYCLFEKGELKNRYSSLFPDTKIQMMHHTAMFSNRKYARFNLGFKR